MKNASLIAAGCAAALAALSTFALADDEDRGRFPRKATFTTHAITPLAIEGLTADNAGNLYTTGREGGTTPCPVWRITAPTLTTQPTLTVVGRIPNPASCNPSGITFDRNGDLYIADSSSGGRIWRLTPDPRNESDPPTATVNTPFATGVPGTNGLAFDRDGNLWTGDGTTGEGRVWRISPSGVVELMFRIQPMANDVIQVTRTDGTVTTVTGGVGRDARSLPPGEIFFVPPQGTAVRSASNTAGSQPLVANGLAFTPDGDLYIADTARGAIWKVELDRRGNVKSKMNCDSTFPEKTLCLDNVFVAHPYLEGTDGIALDRAGNIWNSANERNAIVVVTKRGDVIEVFRNPVNEATRLRNSADPLNTAEANRHILEFPTSPVLIGRKFCTSQSDGDRRDNSPRSAGEVNAGGTVGRRGKISCMDQPLEIPGLPLPVH